jgi:hypothetical protein
MSNSNIGNKALMDYCRVHIPDHGDELKVRRSIADLPDASVASLVKNWPQVVAAVKVAAMPKAPPAAPVAPAPKVETVKVEPKSEPAPAKHEPEKELAPAAPASGMPKFPALAALMTKHGITPERIKAYYVASGHLNADIEPENVPTWYAEKLIANWAKALPKI